MKPTLGDKPIEERHREIMNSLANSLDFAFNGTKTGFDREIGFVLMVFDFGDDRGRCNYISNADRRSVVELLRNQLKNFEEDPQCKGK